MVDFGPRKNSPAEDLDRKYFQMVEKKRKEVLFFGCLCGCLGMLSLIMILLMGIEIWKRMG